MNRSNRSWSRLERLIALLLLTLIACVLTSCASMNATTTQYVGVAHYPPSNPASVEILRTEPTRPHERLGEVMIMASTDPAPDISKVEDKLRKEAAKIGADAVIIVFDQVRPVGVFFSGDYWSQTASTITCRHLVGLAIKYR